MTTDTTVASGVFPRYTVREDPAPVAPAPLRTDIAGFAGRTARGPVGVAVAVDDLTQFQRIYGPDRAGDGGLPAAVRGYFENGGQRAYIVRVLGPGARAATAVLKLPGQTLRIAASSAGAWAQDAAIEVISRPLGAGRTGWSVSVTPLAAPGQRGQAGDIITAATRAGLVSISVEPDGASGVQSAVQPGPEDPEDPVNGARRVRLTGGLDGDPPREPEYWAAVRALTDQAEVALLGLPGIWDDDLDEPYGFIGRVAELLNDELDRMLVLGLPRSASGSAAADAQSLDQLDRELPVPVARAVAVYHPWIQVVGDDGTLQTVSPAGHVLGLFSRLDREAGPSRSPANALMLGVVDVDDRRGSMDPAALARRRVNPIRVVPGRGLQVWGARTFDPSAGRFIAHRRLLHRLIRAMRIGAAPLVFEPEGPVLRRALVRAVTTVLLQAYRSGALAGRTAAEAFSVRCDSGTTPEAQSDAGRVICELSFTPADPIEQITVLLDLGPDGRLEVIEQ